MSAHRTSHRTRPFNPHVIRGPGVWITCVKGREDQAASEATTLFRDMAEIMWPSTTVEKAPAPPMDIADEIQFELSSIKNRPRSHKFDVYFTNTPCVLFVTCRGPVDPTRMVVSYLEDVERTGVTRLRFVQRMLPVAATGAASAADIQVLAKNVLETSFPDTPTTFRIELHIRNHTSLQRQDVIDSVIAGVPRDQGHSAKMDRPDRTVVVEIFKSVCLIGVVPHFERFRKFNPHQIQRLHCRQDDDQ